MRIHELADKKGAAGKWYSVNEATALDGHKGRRDRRRIIFHYSTAMLSFQLGDDDLWDGDISTVDYSIGHGSVSDQNGMNSLFARCAMPFVYRRDYRGGGARIETLNGPHYRYNITHPTLRDRAVRSVSVQEVLDTWPIRMVQI